jgi:protein-L-isoaspartate(D-aspartate) O-methyltransferase
MPTTSALEGKKRALVEGWQKQGYPARLIGAFLRVRREEFVPRVLMGHAYEDTPLPIEHGQRISQPTTIIQMLTLLAPAPGQKVLEVGAGSGYLCAWLAEVGCFVIGIEIVPELAIASGARLEELGYGGRATIYAGDGSIGWESEAPYNRIIISGSIPEIPRHLVSQLCDRGRIVAPVGIGQARMILLEKGPFDASTRLSTGSTQGEPPGGGQEEVRESDHGSFLFSPITGKEGVKEEIWELG